MPSYALPRRTALVPLLLACAVPVGAQAPTHGTDINAAGETARNRAPLFFGSAYVAPKGYLGISLTGSGLTDRGVLRTIDGQADVYERGWGTTVSAVWGATSRLTLATQLGIGQTESEYRFSALPAAPDDSPPRRTMRYGSWSPSDLRVHARYRLLDAGDGATTLALNASLAWPNSSWGYGSVGLALAQRMGRASLHVSPELRFRDGARARVWEFPGEEPFRFPGRTSATLDLRSGTAVAITKRVSWTLEGMGSNLLGDTPRDPRLFELGTGLRLDLGKTLLDVGYRRVVWAGNGADAAGRQQLFIGTHWKF